MNKAKKKAIEYLKECADKRGRYYNPKTRTAKEVYKAFDIVRRETLKEVKNGRTN